MADLYASRGADPDALWRQMKDRMDAEGLAYGKRTHTYNSRLAQEIGKWADTLKNGDELHDRIYRSYFVDAKNVGDPEVLIDLVQKASFDSDAAREVLENRLFEAAVDADADLTGACVVGGLGSVLQQTDWVVLELPGQQNCSAPQYAPVSRYSMETAT